MGGISGESNIANLWKDYFSAIAHSVGSTDNRDQIMNALRTVPVHNYVINVHELRQILKGLKNNKAVDNDGFHLKSIICIRATVDHDVNIPFRCMLTGQLPDSLMHVVIIPLLKCKSKDPADVNNYWPIAITTAQSN